MLREEAARDLEMKRAGWTKRWEYSATGRKENEDRKLKLEELKQKKESLQKDRDAASQAKEEIEAREKEVKDQHEAVWEEMKVGRSNDNSQVKEKIAAREKRSQR